MMEMALVCQPDTPVQRKPRLEPSGPVTHPFAYPSSAAIYHALPHILKMAAMPHIAIAPVARRSLSVSRL
jgi:hypothetical protein